MNRAVARSNKLALMKVVSPPCVSWMFTVLDTMPQGVAFHVYTCDWKVVAKGILAYIYIYSPLRVHYRGMTSE